jgi:hypothetical protein
MTEPETITLEEALHALVASPRPTARPYGYRIEATGNALIADVIATYGMELGSDSEAIRDLLARGAKALAAERA